MICDPFQKEQYHRHRPANLPNSDADRVLVQTGANVPSEDCGDAFHQREETQQLFACPVSVEMVPIKIETPSTPELFALKRDTRPVVSGRGAEDTTGAFRADTTAEFRQAHAAD